MSEYSEQELRIARVGFWAVVAASEAANVTAQIVLIANTEEPGIVALIVCNLLFTLGIGWIAIPLAIVIGVITLALWVYHYLRHPEWDPDVWDIYDAHYAPVLRAIVPRLLREALGVLDA